MRTTLGQLRRLIKEEVYRAILSENAGGLIIKTAEYETVYNDAETRSQESEVLLAGSADGKSFNVTATFTSFTADEKYVLRNIADAINLELYPDDDTSANEFTQEDVKNALGDKLPAIIRGLEEDAEQYEQNSAEAERYANSDW